MATIRPSAPRGATEKAVRLLFPPSLGRPKASARAELVETSLSTALGRPVTVTVTSTYAELVSRGLAGEAEVIWAPAGVCAQLASVARKVFQVVRQGRTHYRSALIVPSTSRLDLERLRVARDLRAAWVDPHSLGGYLLAADLLRRRGVNLQSAFIEQRFMGSHPEALAAVTDGRADIAAVTAWTGDDHDVRTALTMHVGPLESRLAILAVTDEAPTDALILTGALDANSAAVFEALLDGSNPALTNKTYLASAMGAERYVETSIDVYVQLHRRLTHSLHPA